MIQLPKVGDVVEKLHMSREDQRFYFVLENPHERYYKIVNIATGDKHNWNLGWTELAENSWEYEWRIV
jgi:hypothetical protein